MCGNAADRLRGAEIGARVSRPAVAPAVGVHYRMTVRGRTKRVWRPALLKHGLDRKGEAHPLTLITAVKLAGGKAGRADAQNAVP